MMGTCTLGTPEKGPAGEEKRKGFPSRTFKTALVRQAANKNDDEFEGRLGGWLCWLGSGARPRQPRTVVARLPIPPRPARLRLRGQCALHLITASRRAGRGGAHDWVGRIAAISNDFHSRHVGALCKALWALAEPGPSTPSQAPGPQSAWCGVCPWPAQRQRASSGLPLSILHSASPEQRLI